MRRFMEKPPLDIRNLLISLLVKISPFHFNRALFATGFDTFKQCNFDIIFLKDFFENGFGIS